LSLGPSNTLLVISSLGSAVLAGLLDVCELSDSELSDGDRKLALRRCWAGGWGDIAGDKFLPLPSTRPPPNDRREAISRVSRRAGGIQAGVDAICSLGGRRYEALGDERGTAGIFAWLPAGHSISKRVHSRCLVPQQFSGKLNDIQTAFGLCINQSTNTMIMSMGEDAPAGMSYR
jgi:hypothetical protein